MASSFEHPNDLTLADDEFSPHDAPHEGAMLGNSPAMRALQEQIARVARTDVPVLLSGESGTGKDLAASVVHALSRRRDGPFLAFNCGAISPKQIESELFGQERGAFNGGDRMHRGYFERAHRGTLFLDEIDEAPEDLQLKLLRVMERGTFTRVGSRTEIRVDVRLISATDRAPKDNGGLRPDLYHRLAVFPLLVPPLRQRGADVRLLANHFLNQLNQAHGTHKTWSPDALERMDAHPWPGNVRELRRYVERAYALSDGMIDASAAAETAAPVAGPTTANNVVTVPVGTSLEEACRALILATLEHCGGVRKHAAAMLGISLKTLYNKLVAYRAQTRAAASVAPPKGDGRGPL